MTDITPLLNKIHCMDALELMAQLPDASVNAIITDLPYGTTSCSWDEIIPFEPMWAGVKRVLKPRGVFVTTATEPFTSKLIVSNLNMFRYKWAWNKGQGSDFQLAKLRPLSAIEDICVFSDGKCANGASLTMNYYPQMTPHPKPVKSGGNPNARYLNSHNMTKTNYVRYERYPINYLRFDKESGYDRQHPTQKPLDLYKYLVLTYTQPGDVVLDFCCGSGTTPVAAATLNRQFIAGDTDAGYCAIARKRLETVTQDMFAVYGGFEATP